MLAVFCCSTGPIWPSAGSWLGQRPDSPDVEHRRNNRTRRLLKYWIPVSAAHLCYLLVSLRSGWTVIQCVIILRASIVCACFVAFIIEHDIIRARYGAYTFWLVVFFCAPLHFGLIDSLDKNMLEVIFQQCLIVCISMLLQVLIFARVSLCMNLLSVPGVIVFLSRCGIRWILAAGQVPLQFYGCSHDMQRNVKLLCIMIFLIWNVIVPSLVSKCLKRSSCRQDRVTPSPDIMDLGIVSVVPADIAGVATAVEADRSALSSLGNLSTTISPDPAQVRNPQPVVLTVLADVVGAGMEDLETDTAVVQDISNGLIESTLEEHIRNSSSDSSLGIAKSTLPESGHPQQNVYILNLNGEKVLEIPAGEIEQTTILELKTKVSSMTNRAPEYHLFADGGMDGQLLEDCCRLSDLDTPQISMIVACPDPGPFALGQEASWGGDRDTMSQNSVQLHLFNGRWERIKGQASRNQEPDWHLPATPLRGPVTFPGRCLTTFEIDDSTVFVGGCWLQHGLQIRNNQAALFGCMVQIHEGVLVRTDTNARCHYFRRLPTFLGDIDS